MKLNLLITITCFFLSHQTNAIEEKFFNLNGLDQSAVVLKKLGASKETKLPATINKNGTEIKIEENQNRFFSIDFNPAHSFTITDSDLFEKIESSSGPKDVVGHKLIVGDPKAGRIFHLNHELKVSQLDLVPPWTTKEKLKSVKKILDEMSTVKIEKKK